MSVYIYLDDIRTNYNKELANGNDIIFPKTYVEAISALRAYMFKESDIIIDFDHDLGISKTGYDVAKWIVETEYSSEKLQFHIHSANPVGVANIRQLLTHYGYKEI